MLRRDFGYQTQRHRMRGAELGSEGAGQPDPVHPVGPQMIHQEPRPGQEGGLGQLHRPDIVLSYLHLLDP